MDLPIFTQDDLAKTVPLFPITPEPNPSSTEIIEIDFKPNATGHNVFLFNNATFRANYNNPLLLLANQKKHEQYQPEWNIYNFGSNKTIRLVINNLYVAVHPMHIHGHNMVSPSPSYPQTIPPLAPARTEHQSLNTHTVSRIRTMPEEWH